MNRIHTRIGILLALVGALLTAHLALSGRMTRSRIQTVLDEQGEASTRLLTGIAEKTGKQLALFVEDYSHDQEMVAFTTFGAAAWERLNLAAALSNFQASGLWVIDRQGNTLWRQGADGETNLPTEWPMAPERRKVILTERISGHCYFKTTQGLFECRWAPIHKPPVSEPVGVLAAVRRIDRAALREIADLSQSWVHLGSDSPNTGGWGSRPNLVNVLALPGWDGAPVDMLIAESRSPFLARLGELPRETLLNNLIFSGLVFALLAFLLFFWVRNPMVRLSASMEKGDPDLLLPLLSDRTFYGKLAHLIRESFRQRKVLADEVADRQKADAQVRELNSSLEKRVAERTARLEEVVRQLRDEVEQRRRLEERYQHLAYHDVLTGLPNRTLLGDRLTQALAAAKRHSAHVAVIFLDLDRFKFVNDSLGHHVGDMLLVTMAGRLKSCLRRSDTVGRLGGDEFVIILPDLKDDADAERLAASILRQVGEPLTLEGHDLTLTTSIGLARYPEDGEDAESLIKAADTAMYQAKEKGRNLVQVYHPQQLIQVSRTLSLENHLRRALENGELILHYQPLVNLVSGAISGAESLVRWQHPDVGLLFPDEFMPVAEQSGLVVPLGEWVLEAACRQNREWQDEGFPKFPVCVNLSPRHLHHPNLEADIARILKSTGLEPQYLQIEITEHTVLQQNEAVRHVFKRLREQGISISLDDFGTGYSSLGTLRGFPLDKLKIDRSFIRDIPTSENDNAITGAVIHMARHLRLKVVAEGVETAEQVAFLRTQLSDEIQGYYFSHPLPASEFRDLLKSDRRLPNP